MDHACADPGGCARHGFRALVLNRLERLSAALGENADQIDHDAGAVGSGLHRGRIAHVGLDGVNLADPAQRLQMPCQFRAADADADAIVPSGQFPDHMPAQKAGSSKDRDEGIDAG